MVHPDYQYTPADSGDGEHDCQWAPIRVRAGIAHSWWVCTAVWHAMVEVCFEPLSLTWAQNLLGAKLSEYHTGYRAYSRELLESMRLNNLSDDFIFDNQFLAQVVWRGYTIGEVSCSTKYFEDASSINFSAKPEIWVLLSRCSLGIPLAYGLAALPLYLMSRPFCLPSLSTPCL